jgi:hypothetical protein
VLTDIKNALPYLEQTEMRMTLCILLQLFSKLIPVVLCGLGVGMVVGRSRGGPGTRGMYVAA